jgi:hypothetical protein
MRDNAGSESEKGSGYGIGLDNRDASFDRNAPKFWGGRYGWTFDPMKAVRFSRREDPISSA